MKKTAITFIAALVFWGGCSFYSPPKPAADNYYINPNIDIADTGRVVLVQLQNNSSYPQISTDVTRALFEELQKKQLFSVRVVPGTDPQWRSLELDVNWQYTPEQLHLAATTLRCDAILIGTVTEYVPYPHMAVGLHLRMIRCRDNQLLWAFEQVWDTADKKTERRIRRYLTNTSRTGSATLGEQLVTVSSLKFVKFIAHEVASTF